MTNTPKLTVIFPLLLMVFIAVQAYLYTREETSKGEPSAAEETSTPTPPTPTPFQTYNPPEITPEEVYTVALLGDSMTAALGPHGGLFTEKLNQLYEPHGRDILVDNYAVGSTSLLTINDRLTEATSFDDEWTYLPLFERTDVDLIVIESFAYNPLSQYERNQALELRRQILGDLMISLEQNLPQARIVFMSSIAPSLEKFAQSSASLTAEESFLQAEERMVYLQAHIEFAQMHNIPAINIYSESLTLNGDGDLAYINPDDYIHPSAVGIEFISQRMAEYIYQNELLPK